MFMQMPWVCWYIFLAQEPVSGLPEKCPEHRPIDRLSFDGVTYISKEHEHHDRQEHDHRKRYPVLNLVVDSFDTLKLGREVCRH